MEDKEHSRIYQKGYAAGRRILSKRIFRLMKIAESWRDKALRNFELKCQHCAYWVRGRHDTKWGLCKQEHLFGYTNVWATSKTDRNAEIVSQEEFGCINFMRRD